MRDLVARLDPLPGSRRCACGGELRRSHVAYVGRGESVTVMVCRGCGRAYRGATRQAGADDSPSRRSRRPLPAEGPPDNPVIDAETARRLREHFGEGVDGSTAR